jgi:hypothetical protein
VTTSDPPQDGQPLPYLEITDETYAQLAAQTFIVEKPHPNTLLLRGPCPRCRDLVEVPVVTRVFRASRTLRDALHWGGKREQSANHIEPIICTCEHTHPDRPDGRFGCGAYWTFIIPAGSGAP